jgi:hypothetical protein
MKRAYILHLDGEQVRLRLTVAGQRSLRERFGEDSLQIILESAADAEKMAALLEAALNWSGSENTIRSGEELYDRLVDEGWSGQAQFGGLAFDIAAASGLVSPEQARQLTQVVAQAVEEAFQMLEEDGEDGDDPFPED